MKIGPMEIVVVLIVALLVIGPNKLPEYAKKLGLAMKEFKKASESITKELRENVVEPLDEVQKPFKEAVAPITDLKNDITGSFKEVTDTVNSIGKPKKPEAPKAAEAPKPAEAPAEAPAPAEPQAAEEPAEAPAADVPAAEPTEN